MGLRGYGLVALSEGDSEAARKYFERALERHRELDDSSGIARSLGGLGLAALQAGDADAAVTNAKRALDVSQSLDNRYLTARFRGLLGAAETARDGEPSEPDALDDAVATLRESGAVPAAAEVLRQHAQAEYGWGNTDRARELSDQAEACLETCDGIVVCERDELVSLRERLD